MSNLVRSKRCRPSDVRSNRWITLTMIFAMFFFAGQVFAASGKSVKPTVPAQNSARQVAPNDEGSPAPDHSPLAPSAVLAAPPANDTCAGAIPLILNDFVEATTVGANDDYHAPPTAACFSG